MIETSGSYQSAQQILSIRLCADGFSFYVLDADTEHRVQHCAYAVDEESSLTANLKKAFSKWDWLRDSFKEVRVTLCDSRFTFIPLELFEDEMSETVFGYNHPKREGEIVMCNAVRRSNVMVLFGMDGSAFNFLKEIHPTAQVSAQVTEIIECLAVRSQRDNARRLYAVFQQKRMSMLLLAFDSGRFTMANSFDCTTTADALYYMLYAWKELKMDQQSDELTILGHTAQREVLSKELHNYINKVKWERNPADINIEPIF